MIIYLVLAIAILILLLTYSCHRYAVISREMKQLLKVRDTALDIANRVVNTSDSADLYQHILESCLALIPKAKFGSILMFNTDGLLVAKASVGFNHDEISNFKLRLEESFLYIATEGRLDKTVIINRLEDIILQKNIVKSGDRGFAIRSEVSSPLYINNELAGLLCIDGDKNDIFSDQDIYVLDYMSNQISIVINNQKLYGEILALSRYDSLTGLLNRNSFEHEAVKLLDMVSDDMYFVQMDLDNLKQANDNFGHDYGDKVIMNIADIIKSHLGMDDFCGRYGGDEFVAVFRSNLSLVEKTLEKIRTDFMYAQEIYKEGIFTPDISYGIAPLGEGHGSLDALYRYADMRMYEAKSLKKKEK